MSTALLVTRHRTQSILASASGGVQFRGQHPIYGTWYSRRFLRRAPSRQPGLAASAKSPTAPPVSTRSSLAAKSQDPAAVVPITLGSASARLTALSRHRYHAALEAAGKSKTKPKSKPEAGRIQLTAEEREAFKEFEGIFTGTGIFDEDPNLIAGFDAKKEKIRRPGEYKFVKWYDDEWEPGEEEEFRKLEEKWEREKKEEKEAEERAEAERKEFEERKERRRLEAEAKKDDETKQREAEELRMRQEEEESRLEREREAKRSRKEEREALDEHKRDLYKMAREKEKEINLRIKEVKELKAQIRHKEREQKILLAQVKELDRQRKLKTREKRDMTKEHKKEMEIEDRMKQKEMRRKEMEEKQKPAKEAKRSSRKEMSFDEILDETGDPEEELVGGGPDRSLQKWNLPKGTLSKAKRKLDRRVKRSGPRAKLDKSKARKKPKGHRVVEYTKK